VGKRFTDSALWEREWYLNLHPVEKVAWHYITDNCDAVGVWPCAFQKAEFCIGEPVNWDGLREQCNGNIVDLGGGKWFLPDFCAFQYGELREDCKPHASYLSLLRKHGLEGYPKGIHTLKEKEKELEKEKEKRAAEPKTAYAEGVSMKPFEYSALANQYGKDVVDLAIQKVSSQQIKTGKAYKNARGALLQWGIRAALEERKKLGVRQKVEAKVVPCDVCGAECTREFGYWVCKTHGRREELG